MDIYIYILYMCNTLVEYAVYLLFHVDHIVSILDILYYVMLYYMYIVLAFNPTHLHCLFVHVFASIEGGSRRSLSHWRLQAMLLSGRLVERLKYVKI